MRSQSGSGEELPHVPELLVTPLYELFGRNRHKVTQRTLEVRLEQASRGLVVKMRATFRLRDDLDRKSTR